MASTATTTTSSSSSSSSSSCSSSNNSLVTATTTLPLTSPPSTSSTSSSTTVNSHATSNVTTVVSLKKRRSLIPPTWQDNTVRTLKLRDSHEAGLTLAHAFAADDYAQYLVDGPKDMAHLSPETKWKLHVDMLTYTVASHCLGGLVTATGPELDSIALWIPPGRNLDGLWTLLRSGLWRLYFQLSTEGRRRLFEEILPLLHDTKRAVLGKERDHDAWYLVYLGTKPSSQGRGYGSRLLKDMMAKADAENRPIYLESSSLANNVYYEKFGFEIKKEIFLTRDSNPVRLSIMVREAVPPKQQIKVVGGGGGAAAPKASLRSKKQKNHGIGTIMGAVTAGVVGKN